MPKRSRLFACAYMHSTLREGTWLGLRPIKLSKMTLDVLGMNMAQATDITSLKRLTKLEEK